MNKFIYIICGHYGVGKTNVSVNAAMTLKRSSPSLDVTLVDLDIVNPYFRAADNKQMLEGENIRVICPQYANSNVDIPSLPPEINSVFESGVSFIDVGGDDSGATALGGYSEKIKAYGYEMYYVINMYRPTVEQAFDAVEMAKNIEYNSRLKFDGIINNSNLSFETTAQNIKDSFSYAKDISEKLELPVVCTTCLNRLKEEFSTEEKEKHKMFFINDITNHLYL